MTDWYVYERSNKNNQPVVGNEKHERMKDVVPRHTLVQFYVNAYEHPGKGCRI